MYHAFGKRALDVIVAGVALLVLAPILAIVALVVGISIGRPVLFRQRRPGLHGRLFTLIKFRTMSDSRDAHGRMRADAERLGAVGARLRAWSLDELPELWNVLVGDMSLVGPRPLLEQYLDRYTAEQRRRHDVKPGITGWAQINGRNALTWPEKFERDLWYVSHVSLALDAKILVATVWTTLARRGIAHDNHASMPEFTGSRN